MAKGTVEGGYVDTRRLRIKIWKERKSLEEEAAKCRAHGAEVQCQINDTDKEIKSVFDRLQQADRAKKAALGQEADMSSRLNELKRKVCVCACLRVLVTFSCFAQRSH
jgi:septal ring factor EnvC (AmiA/AmiB activator)